MKNKISKHHLIPKHTEKGVRGTNHTDNIKEYALESTKEAPIFLDKKNEDFEEILNETSDVIKRMANK